MSNSINTNASAIVALQSLNQTNSELSTVQKQVSTGFRVADAVDDGAAFAVAQGLRSTVKGYGALTERLSAASGLLSVSSDALSKISDALGDAQAVLVKLSDGDLSATERTQYNADYANIKTEVTNFVNQASFNGQNLLNSATSISTIFDVTGNQFTFTGQNTLGGITAGLASTTDATTSKAQLTALATFQNAVGSSLSTVGGYVTQVQDQSDFVSVLNDATTEGIGAIVDADLAKASAQLQSLQIRQQLGTQSLAIANQAPNILLSLFKG